MSAKEPFQAGRLREAIAAQNEEVKQHPADAAPRAFLAELLCFDGNLDRADKQLDIIAQQNPKLAVGISSFRQLVRAEQARQQFYTDGRLPEFLEPLSAVPRLHLEASVRLREGQAAEAVRLLAEAEEQRPKLTGLGDGQPFEDLRDLDDLTAPFLEVLATNGKYYWVLWEQVERLVFHPPSQPRDLLWRRSHLTCRGSGPDGEVFVPVLYAGTHAEAEDSLRLGRMTDWRGGEGAPVRGVGQRILLMGGVDRPLLELKEIAIDNPLS